MTEYNHHHASRHGHGTAFRRFHLYTYVLHGTYAEPCNGSFAVAAIICGKSCLVLLNWIGLLVLLFAVDCCGLASIENFRDAIVGIP